jgi:beta-N-acetylhexosaminidase
MPTSVLRRTVAGLFMVGIPGPRLDPATRRVLLEHPPGGVVLFRRNVRSATQLRELIGLVRRGRPLRPHLVQRDRDAALGRLPRGFAARQAAAEDGQFR